ncbi:MAG: DUF2116 family Zn-ribbon domain-containing protein [Candidatus Poseidoniaceae archaeon]|jgi:predicted nucleic acid-binding Zn ribbon protein|nr:DUF2116 family Zn-ribbon domain-containing protein [Candidatus Poseidoniaceae archaeon]
MVDAKAVKERVAKKNSNSRTRNNSGNSPHKHCRICGVDINIKSESRVCNDQDCNKKLEKQEKNDRMMRIMFFIFAFAIAAPILLQLMGYGK